MKLRLFLVPTICLSLLVFSTISARSQTVLTFDNLSESGTGSFIANGYQGLVWSNFSCVNAILSTNLPTVGVSGFYYGMVSASNVACDANAGSAQMLSPGTNFNFLSAYLTGAYNSNLNIEVRGFNGNHFLYNTTVVANATSPTLFTFNFQNINDLYFFPFGGQSAGFSGSGEQFVLDNLTFEFIPEPSPLLLVAAGLLALPAFVKRRRG